MTKTSNPSSGEFQDRLVDGRPLYELVAEKVVSWGTYIYWANAATVMWARLSAHLSEMGAVLRKLMPKSFILVPGYGAQGAKGSDLTNYFNEDGLGAIVNSSRGIIAAYKQPKYEKFGAAGFADAARAAVIDMQQDIASALK